MVVTIMVTTTIMCCYCIVTTHVLPSLRVARVVTVISLMSCRWSEPVRSTAWWKSGPASTSTEPACVWPSETSRTTITQLTSAQHATASARRRGRYAAARRRGRYAAARRRGRYAVAQRRERYASISEEARRRVRLSLTITHNTTHGPTQV